MPRLQDKQSIDQLTKLPNINHRTSPHQDFFFFPFYPCTGFTNREDKLSVAGVLYQSILNGTDAAVIKWLDCEDRQVE